MTVGSGFAPALRRSPRKGARGLARLASITAGGDFHPALRADVLLMPQALLSRERERFQGISGHLPSFPDVGAYGRAFSGRGIKKTCVPLEIRLKSVSHILRRPENRLAEEISLSGEFR